MSFWSNRTLVLPLLVYAEVTVLWWVILTFTIRDNCGILFRRADQITWRGRLNINHFGRIFKWPLLMFSCGLHYILSEHLYVCGISYLSSEERKHALDTTVCRRELHLMDVHTVLDIWTGIFLIDGTFCHVVCDLCESNIMSKSVGSPNYSYYLNCIFIVHWNAATLILEMC